MEQTHGGSTVIAVALTVGTVVFILLNYGPVARWFEKSQADPEKGLKAMFIIGMALFVLVGIAMSIAIMLNLLGFG